jgi:hypothetical protein
MRREWEEGLRQRIRALEQKEVRAMDQLQAIAAQNAKLKQQLKDAIQRAEVNFTLMPSEQYEQDV